MGLFNDSKTLEGDPRVRLHANARLTPAARRLLVDRVRKESWAVKTAAEAAGVSRRTGHKWLQRFEEAGESGLADRSSRPRRVPRCTAPRLIERIRVLRRRRQTAFEIAGELGVPRSTVSRVLHRIGLGRLWRVEEVLAPPQRYEHDRPGGMFHIDAKKLGRIQGVGHAMHGDRTRRSRGVGWEVTFVCVDDHTRLAYAEMHPTESAAHATAFFRRALAYFENLGVRCERVLSDNAKAYSSIAFEALCAERGIRHRTTRPYTPRTNGKAERFIQTLLRRWAYRRPYKTSALRANALRPWITEYNHRRPHRALGMRPPMARLREAREQRA
jgi:transposase InsO family protein